MLLGSLRACTTSPYHPANQARALGYLVGQLMWLGIAVWLIVAGIRGKETIGSTRGSITGMQDAAERALTRFRAFATLTVSEPPIVFLAAPFHSPVAQW